MRDSPAYMLYNKMRTIYQNIIRSTTDGSRLLALLIDPDKTDPEGLNALFAKIKGSKVTHIFIGGSTDEKEKDCKGCRTGQTVDKITNSVIFQVIIRRFRERLMVFCS